MGEQRSVHGLTVDKVHRFAGKEVEPVAVRLVEGDNHLLFRGCEAHDRFDQRALALLDVLAHGVKVCGEVDARGEEALFLLALALAVELLPPLGHEAERGLEAREQLDLLALTVELVAHGGVLPRGIAVIVFRAERHHLLRTAHEFIQINARDGDGEKTNGGEHAVASADVVGHDEFLVSLLIGDDDFSVNVISKSGTTTEPAVAFRFFREMLEKKYGKEGAAQRIYATTDAHKGALKALADREGYEEFVVPDNIGGRYSVLTAVGLLPIAVAGVDLDALMGGAQEMMELCTRSDYTNPAWQYAAMRHELYRQGKKVELLACFEPAFRFMAEWWKQLYGESEGKEEKGLFPASVDFTADLHSMGQYIQQGERMLMETVVRFAPAEQQMVVPFDEVNGDGLNFLAGKTMDFINRQAMDGTLLAHVEGGVPNIILNLDENNARTMGQLIYFFEYACGLSGYLLGVNPFDQPGVEAYKKNMFALLGKPGYEEMGEELRKRLR